MQNVPQGISCKKKAPLHVIMARDQIYYCYVTELSKLHSYRSNTMNAMRHYVILARFHVSVAM